MSVCYLVAIFVRFADLEVQRMKKAVESLMAANEEKVRSFILLLKRSKSFFICLRELIRIIYISSGSQDRGASTVTCALQESARHGHVGTGKKR